MKTLVVAVAAVTAGLVLKKHAGEFALALTLLCIAVLCVFALHTFQPVISLLRRLEELSGINAAVMSPMLKTALIGILTAIGAGVCADCGENGIARMVELCGTVMALYLSAPLIESVLDLLDSLLEG